MRKRHLLANRDVIYGVRQLASRVEPCIQVTCSCGLTALVPVPLSERSRGFDEKRVLAALPADERDAIHDFQAEHGLVGHEVTTALVLVGV